MTVDMHVHHLKSDLIKGMSVINNNVPYYRFCDPESSKHCRHEMALDANGRRLLVTSGSVRALIYQVGLELTA